MPDESRNSPHLPISRSASALSIRKPLDSRAGPCRLGKNRPAHAAFFAPAGRGGRPRPDRRHHLYQSRRRRDAPPHSCQNWKTPAGADERRKRRAILDAGSRAARAWRVQALGWKLLDLPAQFASPRSTPFAATWPCNSRCSPRLAADSTSPISPPSCIAAQPASTLERIDENDAHAESGDRRAACYGATTTGRRWKICWWRCSSSATAGCTSLCSTASQIGSRCARGSSGRLPKPLQRRSTTEQTFRPGSGCARGGAGIGAVCMRAKLRRAPSRAGGVGRVSLLRLFNPRRRWMRRVRHTWPCWASAHKRRRVSQAGQCRSRFSQASAKQRKRGSSL